IVPSTSAAGHTIGSPFTLNLMKLNSYQLQTDVAGRDLTGSLVVSNKPIVVLSGHACGHVPTPCCCEHLVEQLPPTSRWGVHYNVVSVEADRSRQIGQDPPSDLVRIISANDNTNVTIKGEYRITTGSLASGQTQDIYLDNDRINSFGTEVEITADKRILVVQYARSGQHRDHFGDPFMRVLPPVGRYVREFSFQTHSFLPSSRYTEEELQPAHFIEIIAPISDAE